MEQIENIKTISHFEETKLKEKGSIFIAQAFPVSSSEKIDSELLATKKKFFDATHLCYAYRLKNDSFKYSDAGEPNGTAGIRILNAIDHFNLTDILVIVIRYFGGTKLGIGPLGRAYYFSTLQTLQNSEIIQKENYTKIKISTDFFLMSSVHRVISNYHAILDKSSYDDQVHFEILIKNLLQQNFIKEIFEISNGKIKVETLEKNIFIKKN